MKPDPSLHPERVQRAAQTSRFAEPHMLLQLQRLLGNRAVGQSLSGAEQRTQPIDRGSSAEPLTLQRMKKQNDKQGGSLWSTLTGFFSKSDSKSQQQEKEQVVIVNGRSFSAIKVGTLFKVFDDDAVFWIRDQGVSEDGQIHDKEVEDLLTTYLAGGTVRLFRGITCWHPNFQNVLNATGDLMPLGVGDIPDFDTRKTSYIPFSGQEDVSRSAARSMFGMDKSDKIQMVYGYDPNNPDFVVGIFITVTVDKTIPICVFDFGEIQVKGPIPKARVTKQIIKMSTPMSEATGHPDQEGILSEFMPPQASDKELQDYRSQYGSLRHEPKGTI
ncbi:MAG: hypothetical protein KatS3mg057_3083 [Herpetosiphonaceae bacterium]|nr:MAG: hypothetical protein KatS3mg057_3083 [Herpetosiphonaceae bacterium]